MTIRAIFFDIGGIFLQEADKSPIQKWEICLGLNGGQLQKMVFESASCKKAWLGQATADDVWNEAASHLTISPQQLEQLKVDFWSGWVWNTELLDYISSLKSKYILGTIADAWPGTREKMLEYINDDIFDLSVFSCEEGDLPPKN